MQKPWGIYIHVPFCERKCTYCNFNTTDFSSLLAERYIQAVALEIAHWGQNLRPVSQDQRLKIDTIYLGGGTPSMVEARLVRTLIEACNSAFDVSDNPEVTIEINPGTFSITKPLEWLSAGINRASVGVQSFIDHELTALSRTHTGNDARKTIALLRDVGFENISLDLIAGLPEQDMAGWEFNLSEALAIAPEHLSLYMLDLKEGTQLYAQLRRGERPKPDDDLTAEMYRMLSDSTESAGYEHYEISNVARLDSERKCEAASPFRSRHNMKYWTAEPFLGVGCGAHSYDGTARWFNILKTENYIQEVSRGGSAIAERNELTESDRAAEALFMGLRLKEGVSLASFQSEYGVDVIERYAKDLPRLTDAGLIELEGGRLTLTPAGRLLSNEVFVSFI